MKPTNIVLIKILAHGEFETQGESYEVIGLLSKESVEQLENSDILKSRRDDLEEISFTEYDLNDVSSHKLFFTQIKEHLMDQEHDWLFEFIEDEFPDVYSEMMELNTSFSKEL